MGPQGMGAGAAKPNVGDLLVVIRKSLAVIVALLQRRVDLTVGQAARGEIRPVFC